MMLSPSLVVGRPSAWIARGDQSELGRRGAASTLPHYQQTQKCVRGTNCTSAALGAPHDRVCHMGKGILVTMQIR
jgi:hypothetical protein